VDNLYHLQNYLLTKNVVLVIFCVGDENSGNFFFTLTTRTEMLFGSFGEKFHHI